MTYQEATTYLKELHKGGIHPGLERMHRAMQLAGDPQRLLRVVHVAGTNGKGSTARMIQSMLTAAGYRTGLYMSPVVTDICDAITVDGHPISQECFAFMIARWKGRQTACEEPLSEFELVTALALEWFCQERVDICVLECGMGGKEDATNICPPPLAAVITPIALDHTAFLGNTIEEVATHKCGIIKPPCTIVTSPGQSPEALAVIFEQAARHGGTVCQPNRAAAIGETYGIGEVSFSWQGVPYTVPLGGAFQVDNALTALETVRELRTAGFFVDDQACRQGLAEATLPCRQEVLCRAPMIVVDGAHNPHGVTGLAAMLRQIPDPITLVIGMLQDKDTAACAALLAPLVSTVVCCTPPSERALPAAQLAEQFAKSGTTTVYVAHEPAAAWNLACGLPGKQALVVGGSFYTAAAIRPLAIQLTLKGQNNR